MSEAESISSLSVTSTHESIHSELSDASELNDHRHQSMSLPVKTDSRKVLEELEGGPIPVPQAIPEEDAVAAPTRLGSTDLRSKMVVADSESETDEEYGIRFAANRIGGFDKRRLTAASLLTRPRSRSSGHTPKTGILLHKDDHLTRQISRTSARSTASVERKKRANEKAIDSDADSHGSRDSQETEEDVCFPMLPEPTRARVKGIDFGEIEDFIKEQNEETETILRREGQLKEKYIDQPENFSGSTTTSSKKFSSAALKYTPKFKKKVEDDSSLHTNRSSDPYYAEMKFGSKSSTEEEDCEKEGVTFEKSTTDQFSAPPDRFSFFSSENEETIHAADFPSLVKPGQPIQELFYGDDATWWLDCTCPTDNEMKMLAKAFGIHPLTAEDIRMQETREKVELFKSYYFVCFHTFETDNESEDFLEPINTYIVVFRYGILTFHFSPIAHPANVRRRVRQLRDYVTVSADWLCYALIDDITDGFAPVIHAIEYEADAIEDSVFVTRDVDFGNMLQRIGDSRRKVMTLMRLLSGKADVIKMFAKRCQDEAGVGNLPNASVSHGNLAQLNGAQPRGDIALYLGDIQDHIITMFQSLLSYEKIFSRSHANYLAQLQVESFNSNNKVTEMLSKVTLIGTILVPLNLVTGLFGMNVHVPGQDIETYAWFFGIVGFIIFVVLFMATFASLWLRRTVDNKGFGIPSQGRSMKSFGLRPFSKPKQAKSVLSLPSKYTRYNY
ncbi:unnamed protein product [Kuraishia capsulata CBS 1993]|uniref:Uncharacterized protein n=1 Tax=Kuraishia capsulata CBS 1993 TaxID=1382522 RepID=W6MIY8_9ASCO|nr:uncharacterized protein KUCA_T00000323001 [Kuraishia capsulata CBS 1993]CDK24362.1 unnamed protein product [Kuraishia capsulata CBS 1993]